jgi:hypothetical protein
MVIEKHFDEHSVKRTDSEHSEFLLFILDTTFFSGIIIL